jgi:hypothetical protein
MVFLAPLYLYRLMHMSRLLSIGSTHRLLSRLLLEKCSHIYFYRQTVQSLSHRLQSLLCADSVARFSDGSVYGQPKLRSPYAEWGEMAGKLEDDAFRAKYVYYRVPIDAFFHRSVFFTSSSIIYSCVSFQLYSTVNFSTDSHSIS